jgi:SPP1 family predicted phage head-tail adaptor
LRAGKLDKKLILQSQSITRDTFGAEVVTWVNTAQVYASMEQVSGRELYTAQQINAEATTKITIRHRKDITPKMRLVYKERVFDIVKFDNVKEASHTIVLTCKEVAI